MGRRPAGASAAWPCRCDRRAAPGRRTRTARRGGPPGPTLWTPATDAARTSPPTLLPDSLGSTRTPARMLTRSRRLFSRPQGKMGSCCDSGPDCVMEVPPTPEDDVLAVPLRARLFEALGALRRPATTQELAAEVRRHPNSTRAQLQRLADAGLIERN